MNRKDFIRNSSFATLGLGTAAWTKPAGRFGNNFAVNEKRIEERIFELAKFGRDDKGRGYRVAFTRGDIEGRAWFMNLMKNAGLELRIDSAGNIIGKRQGKNASLKPIGFGSHIDMVPDGGNYDGTLGSIGALEVIEVFNEKKLITEHSLELIVFSNEEGGTIGSMAMTGHLTAEGLKAISQSGLTMADGMRAIGGNPDDLKSCIRRQGDLHAWVELHIEQGGNLEREGIHVGVVEGIIGLVQWEVTVEGFANHAGTTPMDMRRDALLAASAFVLSVNEVINSVEGKQVGTVGKIAALPGAYNVVPGKVVMALEIRDLSAEKIEMLFLEIEKRSRVIADKYKTSFSFKRQPNESKPALTDKRVQQAIDKAAKQLGLSTRFMPSGAGHDSQHMAEIAPAGMIFIPSIGGISHSPKEYSTPKDMANGVNVLLQTILSLDKSSL